MKKNSKKKRIKASKDFDQIEAAIDQEKKQDVAQFLVCDEVKCIVNGIERKGVVSSTTKENVVVLLGPLEGFTKYQAAKSNHPDGEVLLKKEDCTLVHPFPLEVGKYYLFTPREIQISYLLGIHQVASICRRDNAFTVVEDVCKVLRPPHIAERMTNKHLLTEYRDIREINCKQVYEYIET